jgi:hypothetical protein
MPTKHTSVAKLNDLSLYQIWIGRGKHYLGTNDTSFQAGGMDVALAKDLPALSYV